MVKILVPVGKVSFLPTCEYLKRFLCSSGKPLEVEILVGGLNFSVSYYAVFRVRFLNFE